MAQGKKDEAEQIKAQVIAIRPMSLKSLKRRKKSWAKKLRKE